MGGIAMPDYAKMYRLLFNSQTDAIALQEQATEILKKAQQATEEIYASAPSPDIRMLEPKKPDEPENE
jgi:hypothetical protein